MEEEITGVILSCHVWRQKKMAPGLSRRPVTPEGMSRTKGAAGQVINQADWMPVPA